LIDLAVKNNNRVNRLLAILNAVNVNASYLYASLELYSVLWIVMISNGLGKALSIAPSNEPIYRLNK
tara:strand:+ start:30 stop:230 length:201 start_codon:yes stop_codon:yes gene_type:complete